MNAIEAKNEFVARLKQFLLTLPNVTRSDRKLFVTRNGQREWIDFQMGMHNSTISTYLFINVWQNDSEHQRVQFYLPGSIDDRIVFDTRQLENVPFVSKRFTADDAGIESALQVAIESIRKSPLFV